MIRQATAEDLRALYPLAREFYRSSRILRGFDLERFESFWRVLFGNGCGAIFLLTDGQDIQGTIGGMFYPEPYSGELLAQEFFWFVRKERRGAGVLLYRAFEDWARAQGCVELRMAHLSDSMPEKVADFYRRMGYEKVETLYAKRLDEVAGLRRAG